MKIAIVVNARRKESIQSNELDSLAEKYQLTYDLYFVEPDQLEALLQELMQKSYHVFLVAGGDGTVRTAAQVLVHTEIPLAILPLGTFNHFAKELNFPTDIEELFKIIKNNKTKQVDVGEVNQIIFINHSSIGLYTYVLKVKQKHKKWLGTSRLLKILFTAINIFKVIPIYTLKIKMEGQILILNTCLMFIGNNYYFTNLLDLGSRQTLTAGFLSVYILNCKNRWNLIQVMFKVLFRTLDKTKYIKQFTTDDIIIEAKSKSVNVVVDGEIMKLENPLHYTIHNKKLTVITP